MPTLYYAAVQGSGYSNYIYNERLTLLNLPSLELCRLRLDLIWCYKILFGLISIHVDSADLFEVRQATVTRGHPYKLFKPQCTINARSSFFTQRIINVWNDLPVNSLLISPR